MANAELPSSVLYSSKELGKNTLAFGTDIFKTYEPNGRWFKRQGEAKERLFHITKTGDRVLSAVFRPAKDEDTIGIYPEDSERHKFVIRNGVYIEVGTANQHGAISAKYDLSSGKHLSHSIDSAFFPNASISLESMKKDSIDFIKDFCEALRQPTTPNPKDILQLDSIVDNVIPLSQPSQQNLLFEL